MTGRAGAAGGSLLRLAFRQDHRQKHLVPQQRFIGSYFIQTLSLGQPALAPQFEQGGCVAGRDIGIIEEAVSREPNADQREQAVRLAVARPDDFVIPGRVFPSAAFRPGLCGQAPRGTWPRAVRAGGRKMPLACSSRNSRRSTRSEPAPATSKCEGSGGQHPL